MNYLNGSCANCGAPLGGIQAVNGIVECGHCHSVFPVARSSDSRVLAFLQMGEHEADVGDFDKARDAYAKAAELDKNEPAAYWGMALAEFRVRFLKDEVNDRLQPICHEISEKVFSKCDNYKKAIACGTHEQGAEYERIAHEIDYIRSEFYRFRKEGIDYDCFICVKVTDDETKRKTLDSDRANDLYYHLRDRGYKPFYSEREIQNKQGADYEARILYALYSSETMIIVCGDESYLHTKWVKNEYSRFIGLIRDEQKEFDSVTVAWFDKPIERLPGRDGKIQGVCLNAPDAYSKLIDFIDAHYQASFIAPEIVRKTYGGATYDKRTVVKTQLVKRKLERIGGVAISASDNSILQNAREFLTRGDFANATKFVELLIKSNPSNSEAYLIGFLAENKCKNEAEYEHSENDTVSFVNLESAISVAANDGAAQKLYRLLYNHVKNTQELSAYNEFITLPDSTEKQIAELNAVMYNNAHCTKSVFNAVIQTVTDARLFTVMNLAFARRINNGTADGIKAAAKYYRDVLEKADAGHGEALWYVFIADKNISDYAAYFCDQNNFGEIESTLFAYGYNEFAANKLFAICKNEISGKNEKAIALFNLLLSLIPKENNNEYCSQIKNVVNILMSIGSFANAKQYNDMYIAENAKDDAAHLTACLINHKMYNPLSLLRFGDTLLEDPEFRAAFDLYPENHPGESNLYMNIYMFVQDNIDLAAIEMPFSAAEKDRYVGVDELCSCRDKMIDYYMRKANETWTSVLHKYDCNSFGNLLHSTKVVSDDPALEKIFLFSLAYEYCNDSNKKAYIVKDNPFGGGRIPYKPLRDITCEKCNGMGYMPDVVCHDCYGTGRFLKTCPSCGGDGYYELTGGKRGNCFRCKGAGKIKSGYACPSCDGKGLIDKICDSCNGTGVHYENNIPLYVCVEYIKIHMKEKIESNKKIKARKESIGKEKNKRIETQAKMQASTDRHAIAGVIAMEIIVNLIALILLLTHVVTGEAKAFIGGGCGGYGFIGIIAGFLVFRKKDKNTCANIWLIGGILFEVLVILIAVLP